MTREFDRDAVVIRDGAAVRTADELVSLFILEAGVLTSGVAGSDYSTDTDERIPDYVRTAMADADEHGWCDDADNSQALSDFRDVAEGWLSDHNLYAFWNDGYVIYDTSAWSNDDWAETENW